MAHDLPLFSSPPKELEDHPLFSKKNSVGIVTAENPMVAPAVPGGNDALKELLKRWKLPHQEVNGHYGAPEKSLIVEGPTREQMFHLGRMFGQEAVIYGHRGYHELIFAHGPKAGHLHPSHGVAAFHPTHAPPDYYTHLPGKGYVRLHFDESKLVPAPLKPYPYLGPVPEKTPEPVQNDRQVVARGLAKALRKAIEEATRKPAAWPGAVPWHETHTAHNFKGMLAGVLVPGEFFQQPMMKAEGGASPDFSGGETHPDNEQAAVKGTSKLFASHALPFGHVDPSHPTVLKHYPLEGKDAAVDSLMKQHGVQVYYMGGKHGRPDLANRNFNTRHIAIWSPEDTSTGDFGEASYQNNWRRLHELAHFLTYPQINAKWGEGRRIGALGRQRSLREAKRAVSWEDAAAHKQRELSAQIGAHISDEDFNREYNAVLADATHRAISGKFVDINSEGFRPHSTHRVPIETTLGMIDDAGRRMGLKGEHDLLPR